MNYTKLNTCKTTESGRGKKKSREIEKKTQRVNVTCQVWAYIPLRVYFDTVMIWCPSRCILKTCSFQGNLAPNSSPVTAVRRLRSNYGFYTACFINIFEKSMNKDIWRISGAMKTRSGLLKWTIIKQSARFGGVNDPPFRQ